MLHRLLIDNWTLQNAGEIICDGLDGGNAHDLVFTTSGKNYRYDDVSADVLRFEALCQFLNNIVFADELYMEERFADAWARFSPLNRAEAAGILIKKPFGDFSGEWVLAREEIADRLCVNTPLLKAHRANRRTYEKLGKVKDAFLSQLLWGGAGMLARSDYFHLPYVPHPSRARLLSRAGIFLGVPTATARFDEFVSGERTKIRKRIGGNGAAAEMLLPPVAVQILEESLDLSEIVPNALQLRDDFKSLRFWLAKLQRAFEEDNTKEILAHQLELESVARHVDSYSSSNPQGDTTIQLGVSWLKIGFKSGSPMNTFKNMFGMRAELNRLILAPAGRNCVKKFAKMLGEQHTKRGSSFVESVIQRFPVKK